METGILHLHVTVVTVFLILLLVKTILLLIKKTNLLDKIRAKTKVLDMILGVLILATGGYLLFLKSSPELYHYVKIVVMLIAIPLGIVGIKRKKLVLALISLLAFIYIYGVAETKSHKFKRDKFELTEYAEDEATNNIVNQNMATNMKRAKAIYNALCAECHGEDGKKGLFNAKDLTASSLTNEQQDDIITNGKGTMRAFKNDLGEPEIESLVAYIKTL